MAAKSKLNPKIVDHSNDPFVVKKVKTATAIIKKFGLPPNLKNPDAMPSPTVPKT